MPLPRSTSQADAWRAQEAKSGRVYDCANRSVSGFPFRLEVRCDGATVTLVSQTAGASAQAPITAKLGEILVVAQVYDPKSRDRGIHGARNGLRPSGASLDDVVNWRTRPQQRVRTAGRAAARLHRVRRCRDRSRRRIDADAAGARQAHRTARPLAEGSAADHPVIESVLEISGRQRQGCIRCSPSRSMPMCGRC